MRDNETVLEIAAEFRKMNDASVGGIIAVKADVIADRLEAAAKQGAVKIERVVRDAIIGYEEMYPRAPNDQAERELKERANTANAWLVSHGLDPQELYWTKEEAPCL